MARTPDSLAVVYQKNKEIHEVFKEELRDNSYRVKKFRDWLDSWETDIFEILAIQMASIKARAINGDNTELSMGSVVDAYNKVANVYQKLSDQRESLLEKLETYEEPLLQVDAEVVDEEQEKIDRRVKKLFEMFLGMAARIGEEPEQAILSLEHYVKDNEPKRSKKSD
jgi:hypothetical protein